MILSIILFQNEIIPFELIIINDKFTTPLIYLSGYTVGKKFNIYI